MSVRGTLWWLSCVILAAPLSAQSPGADLFETKIRPVLAANCYGCHSSKLKSPMGGLVLDTKAGMLKGGGSGPVLSPGHPETSLLIRALRYNDLQLKMPPAGKLPDSAIAGFEEWIAAGAPDPRTDAASAAGVPAARTIDFEKGRQWWAFKPARELPAPRVRNAAWPRSKIDSFILAKLEQKKLKPSAQADPRTLVRRAYLDLVGLRPSYDEVEAFVNDPAPDRYEKLVDRLLASPHYGERWGRYWLDVSRYGEDGENGAGGYLYAWRYRDWVIDALNNDLPYDQFVKMQLAADHMPGVKRSDLAALGYLGLSPAEHKELKLSKVLIENLLLEEWDERLDAVGRGVLGLTVACARCHDHKFDPISTKDYYALAGVFASTASAMRPLHDVDPATEARFIWVRERLQTLNFIVTTLTSNPGLNAELSAKQVAESQAEIAALRAELDSLKAPYPELAENLTKVVPMPKTADDAGAGAGRRGRAKEDPTGPFLNTVYDAGIFVNGSHPDVSPMEYRPGTPRNLPVYFKGNAERPGEIVPRRFLTVLSKNPNDVFREGSGRLELAEKIFTDAAPLTARVIVNRVWGWHFDRHIVGTPSDFGTRGDLPTHPEMLDDLAARFMAHGWSMKWLHREIMLSATYRQSSRPRADAMQVDPANQLLWRMNPRRLDIEAYRDSLLEAAGKLDLELHGPSVDLDAPDNTRRTVYAKIGRLRTSDLLRLYDFPSAIQTSPMRVLTITPLQQLFVMNSPFIEQLSTTLAKAEEQEPDSAAKIRDLYRKTLARNPTPSEVDFALSYLNTAPLERFAQILLATNEEIFWP